MGAKPLNVLSLDRCRAIDELLASGNQTAAAAAAGITHRTLRRWLTEPAFVAALDAAQDQLLDNVTVDLVRAASGAVALLDRVVSDPDAKTALRIRAAAILLDSVLRWRELRTVSRRLDALEQIFKEDGGTL